MAEAPSLQVSWGFQGTLQTQGAPETGEKARLFWRHSSTGEWGWHSPEASPSGPNCNFNPVRVWQVGAGEKEKKEKSPSREGGNTFPEAVLFCCGSLVLVFLISLYGHQGIYIHHRTTPPEVRAKVGKGGMPLTREPIQEWMVWGCVHQFLLCKQREIEKIAMFYHVGWTGIGDTVIRCACIITPPNNRHVE